MTSIYSGPPQSFCFLRDNGQYTNPDNEQQFFTCTDNIGSACQMCPGNLVFKAKCSQCLAVNIDCPTTTAKPTQAKLTTIMTTAAATKCKFIPNNFLKIFVYLKRKIMFMTFN